MTIRKDTVILISTKLEQEKKSVGLDYTPQPISVHEKTQRPNQLIKDGWAGWVGDPSLVAPGGFQSPLSYFGTKMLRVEVGEEQ